MRPDQIGLMRRWPVLLFALLAGCGPKTHPPASPIILWAWERPEDLRFLPGNVDVAVQSGFIEIAGDSFTARGRRYPLRVSKPPEIALVHIQIAPERPVQWTPTLRRRVAGAVLHYATRIPAKRVQIDFEVRASERQILLDVLTDVRKGLPGGTLLSMTALASWCDDERWIDAAPVDEIVPMLFRMGRTDPLIRARLEKGGDFRNPRCRTALALSTDTPITRAPAGRRVYVFDPRSWTKADFDSVRRQIGGWR